MNPELAFWWVMVNVIAVGCGPFVANVVLFLLLRQTDPTVRLDPWAAYRDGQLGFVATGWAAVTLYDIAGHEHAFRHVGAMQTLLAACVVFGALFAAGGARRPVNPAKYEPACGTGIVARIWLRAKLYASCVTSLAFALLALLLMSIVHFNLTS